MPPEPFFLRYENYVSPAPGPEIFEIDAEGPGLPEFRRQSWQDQPRGARQKRLLDPADLAAVQQLVLREMDFFALPHELTPPAAARPDLDWPHFLLRYGGRVHDCGGPGAGAAYPALGRLQELLLNLYGQYFLHLR